MDTSEVYGRRAELTYQSRNECRGLPTSSNQWCWEAGCNMAPGRSEKGMCNVYIAYVFINTGVAKGKS